MKKTSHKINQSNTLLMISSIYTSLTKAEKKVADVVHANPEEAVMATVTDLAQQANVGETSVIRFCRKLGFRGYQEFKLSIAQDLVNVPAFSNVELEKGDDPHTVAHKVTLRNETILKHTLDLIDPNQLKQAAQQLQAAKKIYVYGVGSSGITALDLHYRLMRLGMNAEVHRDSHIIAMSAALVKKGDVVFGISTSGSTKDLVDPIKEARENGADVICLTSHVRSPITAYANTVLLVPAREMPTEGGALSTKIGQIQLIDIVCTLLQMNNAKTSQALEKTAHSVVDKFY